jgi:uncharacterized LabA/DUF88 family protein
VGGGGGSTVTIVTEGSAFTVVAATHAGRGKYIRAGGDVTFDNAETYAAGEVYNLRATAAIELIEIPGRGYSGKHSADIRMAVDAMDMCWSKEHIDSFVVASGDSDFSPLVSKLKENDKYVIGVGVKNSSSDLLIDNCDEFIFYEDLVRGVARTPNVATFKDKKQGEVFKLLIDSIKALMRENKEILWGSMVKQTMQRKKPTFNEEYYGYNTFSDLLEDAQNNNIIKIKKDQKSGSYVITGMAQPV